MTSDDIVNGLKHTADDHPCCKVFLLAAVDEIERLNRRTVSATMMELQDARKEIEQLRDELYRVRDLVGQVDYDLITQLLEKG